MNNNIKNFVLPSEIELLFDNKKLDILKYLGILYFYQKECNKKRMNVEEILKCYVYLNFGKNEENLPRVYKFLRDKQNVNEVILYLYNLKFIEIYGDLYTPTMKIAIVITEEGILTMNSLESKNINLYLEYIFGKIRYYQGRYVDKNINDFLFEGEF